jgi:Spy/CpxP family protein refolding chaperone
MNLDLRSRVCIGALAFWVPNMAPGMGLGPVSQGELWQNPKMAVELGLTDEQISQLKNADLFFRERYMKLKNEWDYLHLKIENTLSDETVDEEAVREAAREMAGVMGALFFQHIELNLTAERILTPDQRGKLKLLESCGRPRKEGSDEKAKKL